VSLLALAHALGFRVIPGLFVGCIAIAVPENELGALEGPKGTPHVRVMLDPHPGLDAPASAPRPGPGARSPGETAYSTRDRESRPEIGYSEAFTIPVRDIAPAPIDARSGAALRDGVHQVRHGQANHAGIAYLARNEADRDHAASASGPGLVSMRSDVAGTAPQPFSRADISVPSEAAGPAPGPLQPPEFWSVPTIAYAPVALDFVPGQPEVTSGTAGESRGPNAPAPGLAEELPTAAAFVEISGATTPTPEGNGEIPPFGPVGVSDKNILRPEDLVIVPAAGIDADALPGTGPSDQATGASGLIGGADIGITFAAADSAPSGETLQADLTARFGGSMASASAHLGGAEFFESGNLTPAGVVVSTPLPGALAEAPAGATQAVPQVIPLRTLVELLSEHFEPDELERFRKSPAIDAAVPVEELEEAGLQLAAGHAVDGAITGLAGMQAAPAVTTSGQSGSDGRGGGFAGLSQSLVATASAGFDSNPFLGSANDASAASIRFQLAPSLSRSSERDTFRLSGRVEHIEYLGNYRSLQNFGADLAGSHRATERLTIDAGLQFSSNVLATNVADPFFTDNLSPDAPLPPTGNDITVLGQGQRRTQFGANAGLTYTLSERDQLRWTLTGRADRFGGSGLTESNFVAQQLQFSRQLDEGLSIGALLDASVIDFTDAANGDAKTFAPQLQVRAALTPRLEVTGSVGLSFTRFDFGGLEETNTAFAGNLSLCNRGDRSNFCITGSRQVLPAAVGGALLQTRVGVSYSLRVSERDTLQLNGNYATASRPVTTIGPTDFESVNGFIRYERQLDERLRLFVSGGYLNTSGNIPGGATNIQALVGITFNLGRDR
jgi:hypothetical protein